jgi:hypothetical protein
MKTMIAASLFSLVVVSALPVASADFFDSNYHQYILYNMDQPNIDVLILPSSSPYALRDMALMYQSVQAWDSGINTLGTGWLATGLNIHVYRVGTDTIPTQALWDPEIVIVPAEYNPVLLFGIGLEVMNNAGVHYCHGIPPPLAYTAGQLAAMPGFHTHAGSGWGMVNVDTTNAAYANCNAGGTVCFAVNTNFLDVPNDPNRRDMYDLNSHEFGHCLGIGHVGDALDFTASTYPRDDIMSYENDGWDPGHVLCVSTLDILGLKQVYGALLGQAGYPASPADTFVTQSPSAWSTVSCAEPTAGILGVAATDAAAGGASAPQFMPPCLAPLAGRC